ncbi:IucA/IucC family siderophore biosynthesis protein [Paenibacillus sp. 1011MAR3C5]|uniref:IucA/IucC family protein n=1 Tax=Paenibacillus sp. 1011MAR3C5 TaxID=1675787 RepID=UPI000E6D33F3|nr:IucA/IucC family protein [Paenibacillus sp. 1011MAR3C5]RJE87514.1 IucA/IucC family siderophore biosynthesis protein [Paenibacillus sp. 1011MAR3C5]
MVNPKQVAERAAVTSFLNCYLRETGDGEWLECKGSEGERSVLRLPLASGQLAILATAHYKSPTGRHQFQLPICLQSGAAEPWPIGFATALGLLADELGSKHEGAETKELLLRALQSCSLLETFLSARHDDAPELYSPSLTFLQSEQSLLFGHVFHPTPKSRQGFPEWRQHLYSPESKGSFQLHYFAAHRSLVQEGTVWRESAAEIMKRELLASFNPGERLSAAAADVIHDPSYVWIPVHPVQGEELLQDALIQSWMREGKLEYIGALGGTYYPTSSIRTVCDPQSDYMYKLSLRAKITNSMRVNKRHELYGAIEAARLANGLEPWLRENCPGFHIIKDGAYITLSDSGTGESGFELLIRENPFARNAGERVFLAAAFTQEAFSSNGSRPLLENVVRELAKREGCSAAQAGLAWFRAYLAISLRPMIMMYARYGIALEAHLQNSVVKLGESGYPEQFYYRDSQGYYYARSRVNELEELVPGIGSGPNVYADELAEERFGYYLIVNHVLGLIQSFGVFGVLDERVLLMELRDELESIAAVPGAHSGLVRDWLTRRTFRFKANLLTRLFDVDELETEWEQAVYAEMDNPLCAALPYQEAIRKARLVSAMWRKERKAQQSRQA